MCNCSMEGFLAEDFEDVVDCVDDNSKSNNNNLKNNLNSSNNSLNNSSSTILSLNVSCKELKIQKNSYDLYLVYKKTITNRKK